MKDYPASCSVVPLSIGLSRAAAADVPEQGRKFPHAWLAKIVAINLS